MGAANAATAAVPTNRHKRAASQRLGPYMKSPRCPVGNPGMLGKAYVEVNIKRGCRDRIQFAVSHLVQRRSRIPLAGASSSCGQHWRRSRRGEGVLLAPAETSRGVASLLVETTLKRIELLREVVPKLPVSWASLIAALGQCKNREAAERTGRGGAIARSDPASRRAKRPVRIRRRDRRNRPRARGRPAAWPQPSYIPIPKGTS